MPAFTNRRASEKLLSPLGQPFLPSTSPSVAGDDDCEVDLQWNSIRRGCTGFLVQPTTDPAALTGWTYALNCSKGKFTLTDLASATRQ